jgi:hypothetical protein
MPPQETGKQKAARIPLDYYKHPDTIQKVKRWLWIVALVLSGLWLVGGVLSGNQAQQPYSRGPVAEVHYKWNDDCARCHTSFHPLSGENWMNRVVNPHTSDAKCEACHAGPVHHKSQKMEDTDSCAGCHPDHHGREAPLIRHDNEQCTSCHTNLSAHMNGSTRNQNDVSRFDANDKDHPEFKLIHDKQPDKGTIKFDHKLHMTPGLVLAEGGKKWTLANVAASDREHFRQLQSAKEDTAAVQLDCQACHQVVSEAARQKPAFTEGSPIPLTRDYGGYMKPVKYETACKGCHPLTLPGLSEPVPHGKQPPEILAFLKSHYETAKEPELRPSTNRGRLLPGQIAEASRSPAGGREQLMKDAEIILFRGKTTCGECHHYDAQEGQVVPTRIRAAEVPEIWFRHAKFDHRAHAKGVAECRTCHEAAYTSTRSSDVMIPGKSNCLTCHSATATASAHPARFDCAECHYFHGADANDERSVAGRIWDAHQAASGLDNRGMVLRALLRKD